MTVVEAIVYGIWWYAILTASALLTYPLIYLACQGLSDRGLSLCRPVGIVIIVLPVWWLGNITPLPFSVITITGVALIIGLASWLLVGRYLEIGSLLRTHWFRLAAIEFFSGAIYFGYLAIKGFNPDIQGTEKPMELAFLNAAIVSDSLPLGDPWFAGEPINYYYFGYAAFGAVAKVAHVPGEIAFNLSLATTFMMAAVAAGGLAANLVDRFPSVPGWAPGVSALLTGILLAFSGNLYAAVQLLRAPGRTVSASWWDGVGWESSRVIEDTGFPDGGTRTVITEFPAFSWVLGDLHPHVLAYPWMITAIALIVGLMFVLRRDITLPGAIFRSAPVGIGIGVLYSANTWDVPFIVLVTGIALFLVGRRIGWSVPFVSGMIVLLSALLAAVPFAVNYTAAAGDPSVDVNNGIGQVPGAAFIASTIGVVDWDRTPISDLLVVHGVFLALLVVVLLGSALHRRMLTWSALAIFIIGIDLLILGAMLLETIAVLVIGFPIVMLAVSLAWRTASDTARSFVMLLLMAALTVIILLEFFFIHDPFGDRMNTVFKLYFQIWAVFAVAIGALLPVAIHSLHRYVRAPGTSVIVLLVLVVLAAASVYAPISIYRWNNEFSTWHGLSGLRYLERVNPHEAAAIEWLNDNAGSSAVVVEAPGCSYGTENMTPHNRISMGTGIPTILGWEGHEFQWRRQQPRLVSEIERRQEQVATIYEDPTGSDAPRYLDDYDVTHIVVGLHETQGYRNCDVGPPYAENGLDELARTIWQPAFQSGPVKVLAPNPEGFVAN